MLPFLLLLLPGQALAWPDESEWEPLERYGNNITDASGDTSGTAYTTALDIVGDDAESAGFWFVDQDTLYLRVRVNDDPNEQSQATWGFLIEADGDPTNYEHSLLFAWSTPNGCHDIGANTDGGIGADDPPDDSLSQYQDPLAVRMTEAPSSMGGTTDWFVSLLFPITNLRDLGVIDTTTSFQLAIGTAAHWADTLTTDLAGTDDSRILGNLSSVWSDPICIDEDGDTLHYFDEIALGCDPGLADSDGDTLDDSEEFALGTDCADRDSDYDGILDGEEADCVMGGSSADRDHDNLADGTEGTGDTDLDGHPDFCDEDSDGDGRPDADEELADDDCDGIRNFQDRYDTDGPCAAQPDTGSPPDTAGTECTAGYDPDDPDRCGGTFGGGGCACASPDRAGGAAGSLAMLVLLILQRALSGRPGGLSLVRSRGGLD